MEKKKTHSEKNTATRDLLPHLDSDEKLSDGLHNIDEKEVEMEDDADNDSKENDES